MTPKLPRNEHILLLGAGASVEAGVPAAKDMARTAYEGVREQSDLGGRALIAAIGGLRMFRSVAQGAPFGDVDVEDVYQTLRLLADRNQSLLSPFVGSWSGAVTDVDRADLRGAASRVTHQLGTQLDKLTSYVDDGGDPRSRPTFGYHDTMGFEESLAAALRAASSPDGSAFGLAAMPFT